MLRGAPSPRLARARVRGVRPAGCGARGAPVCARRGVSAGRALHRDRAHLASVAFGLAQFGPAARVVDRAMEILGIDEGLHDEERMSIGGLPGGAESRDQAAQRRRTEVRHRALQQEEKTDIVGDQSEAATALLIGPPDPLIAGPQMPGGRRKNQHRHPGARCPARRSPISATARRPPARRQDSAGRRAGPVCARSSGVASRCTCTCAKRRRVLPGAAGRVEGSGPVTWPHVEKIFRHRSAKSIQRRRINHLTVFRHMR